MDRSRAHAAVLDLLERRHGVGARAVALPAWMELRLDRALDALAASLGGLERALEVLASEPARLEEIAELLRVGETSFFRDRPQWEAIRDVVVPSLGRRDRVRALSAGCSTGEEAWTLGMLLDAAGVGYRVVGMDRSDVALATARDGVYPTASAERVPPELASRYLIAEGDAVRVADGLRPYTTFVARDVMIGPPPGSYEIIVCKNVLIYFGDDAGERAVQLLLRSLSDDGVLLVARSEVPRLRAMGHTADEIGPGITAFRT